MRFVLALVTATLATACADAPVALPPPAAPRRIIAWQQFCEQAWNVPQANALVAARGVAGWELVAMYNGVFCYKRPIPEPSLPRPANPPASTAAGPVFLDPGF
jgi:hypothetical protein